MTKVSISGSSRREFLTALGALGASPLLPNGAWCEQTSAAEIKPRLIDVHHHVFPP